MAEFGFAQENLGLGCQGAQEPDSLPARSRTRSGLCSQHYTPKGQFVRTARNPFWRDSGWISGFFLVFVGYQTRLNSATIPLTAGEIPEPLLLPAAPFRGCQQQTPPPVLVSQLEAGNYREWRLPVSHFRALPSPCLEQKFRSLYPTSPAEPVKGRVCAPPRPILAGTQLRFCVEKKFQVLQLEEKIILKTQVIKFQTGLGWKGP